MSRTYTVHGSVLSHSIASPKSHSRRETTREVGLGRDTYLFVQARMSRSVCIPNAGRLRTCLHMIIHYVKEVQVALVGLAPHRRMPLYGYALWTRTQRNRRERIQERDRVQKENLSLRNLEVIMRPAFPLRPGTAIPTTKSASDSSRQRLPARYAGVTSEAESGLEA